jgi:hypothetical protein
MTKFEIHIVKWFDRMYYIFLVCSITFVIFTSIDLLFKLDWGFSMEDLFISSGLVIFSNILHKIGHWIFRFKSR